MAPKARTIPIVPLPLGQVILPGISGRILLHNRTDIAAILARTYSLSSAQQREASSVVIGCVPLNSPYLSPDGKRLIGSAEDAERGTKPTGSDADASNARKPDLFLHGTLGKVTAVQGRRPGELMLIVEGMQRFKISRFTKETPFFEARVVLHEDTPADEKDIEVVQLFSRLKQLSRELIALMKLSVMMPRNAVPSMPPSLLARLEPFIMRKNLDEAGVLADFMTNVIECTHEDKLRLLATYPIKARLALIVELLQKQIDKTHANGSNQVAAALSRGVPPAIDQGQDVDLLNRIRSQLARRGGGGGGFMPPGFGRPGGPMGGPPDEEANEVDELKKKIQEANLTPEAQKVADKELQRLAKMNPAQAEHQVVRNYLEHLAEIPWTKCTEDNLNAATLARARKQLDDDHYGLEKIKKRLLEYLAVLKLKQAVNQDLEKQIETIDAVEKAKRKEETAASKAGGDTDIDAEEDADVEEDIAPTSRYLKQQAQRAKQIEPPREQTPEEIIILKKKKMVDKSPILLLVGPPGTGKTSLAKSVATSLGREFHRISLGGVRDEAEIRGHRRTYVAAMPGLIVNGLKKVGVANPVFLLDEIDKVGTSSYHGDPSAAMLEVLDPEQNHSFVDHYVNIPIDLSKVLFIATANSLDTIPAPLLDRMETIQLSGYTTLEKRAIAIRHLIPKQITTNGLLPENVILKDEVVDKVITSYTREAGVRNLEREIGSVCRSKAVQYAEAKDTDTLQSYSPAVELDHLEDILGIERFEEELAARSSQPGVVTGLVAYSTGAQGSILFIEVADMPGHGRVQLTGKLGEVLKESVEVALSWVKSHAYELGLTPDPATDIMKDRSIHVHCPSGAIPKDGPSAGLAHTVALISLFSGKAVPPSIAMTGEVSLRGKVMPVGGIKEKLIGALRAGVKKVLLPQQNRKDVKDLPAEVLEGLKIVHVRHVWEALGHIWPDAVWPGPRSFNGVEPRL